MCDDNEQGVLFASGLSRRIEVQFDEPDTTSDGGAVLLAQVDRSLGLTSSLARAVREWRSDSRIEHSLESLVRQRVFGIACGYADCNDSARLRHDPMQQELAGTAETHLASQPTLSRFERQVSRGSLLRMGATLTDSVIERLKKRHPRARRITLDLDSTVDPTHGRQQLSLFHGKYGTWCYLPQLCFATIDGDPEQYLLAALLRPGTAHEVDGGLWLIRRMVERLRAAFPMAKVRVRLDAGFSGPELFALLKELKVEYVVSMAGNPVLARRSAKLVEFAWELSAITGQSARCYGETRYAARSWKGEARRVVFKAEVTREGDKPARENPRYVVTNLRRGSPKSVYETYCQRGDVENRIKELKDDLSIDRTSCSSFAANQLRVLLTAAAYALYQALRSELAQRGEARAQVGTMRLQLIKIGARVVRSVRRVVLHLAAQHPWRDAWTRLALRLGAVPIATPA